MINVVLSRYDQAVATLERAAPDLLPTLARIVFAGVLLVYFWTSAMTKIGAGPFGFLSPSASAYIQIFPRAMETAGYDVSQLGIFHWAVVAAGTWAEFLLPLLIVIGLFTRIAALGMAGFIVVQSLTDVVAHGVAGDDIGTWFDAASDALILDQRAMWMLLLAVPALLGAGRISIDALLRRRNNLQFS